MHLYAFSIRGKTLFFSGIIPEGMFEDVERIANEVAGNAANEEFVLQLVENLFDKLEIKLEHCPIEYVFRVRKTDGYHVD